MPILLIFLLVYTSSTQQSHPLRDACNHSIFCSDQILSSVAATGIFSDSKQFVDAILTVPVSQALEVFKKQGVNVFLQKCIDTQGSKKILEPAKLPDFQNYPQFLHRIKDYSLRQFAYDLNKRWGELGRRVNLGYNKTECQQDCTSYLKIIDGYTIVVPGGRFQESYYWDTYWIIRGLIVCDMLDTATQLVDNFAKVIHQYGFIPNGLRQYYLDRSQPPFFALMAKQVIYALRNKGHQLKAQELEHRVFKAFLKEHEFWMKEHSLKIAIQGHTYTLNIYNSSRKSPRPESFKQDEAIVKEISTPEQKIRIWNSIACMAQSGWDFSSRWLHNGSDLTTSFIKEIIPTDLNTVLALSEAYGLTLAEKYGHLDAFMVFRKQLQERKEYFRIIEQNSIYPDYNFQTRSLSSQQHPSALYPNLLFKQKISIQLPYLINPAASNIKDTGNQWDYPNVWAPNVWILHQVLKEDQAYDVAQKWVETVFCSWKLEKSIYEKYDANIRGKRGSGGEYVVQLGFGWTNGVVLEFLNRYANRLQSPKC